MVRQKYRIWGLHPLRFCGLHSSTDFGEFSRMKRQWRPAKISFLAHNVVQTKGRASQHIFSHKVNKYLPEIASKLREEMPLSYPHMQAVACTNSEIADRESRVFINVMVSERVKCEKECQRRMKISRAVWISSLIRRHHKGYLGDLKFWVKSRSGGDGKSYIYPHKRQDTQLNRGEFLREAESELDIRHIDSEVQMDFDYIQVHPSIKYQGWLVPFHQEALDMIPTENNWDLNMTHTGAISLRRMGDRVVNSTVVKAKKLVKLNILSRISPRIRKCKRDHNAKRTRGADPEVTERAITKSHKKLTLFFM